eukprot:jgi/Mesen1/711/ME000109S_10927
MATCSVPRMCAIPTRGLAKSSASCPVHSATFATRSPPPANLRVEIKSRSRNEPRSGLSSLQLFPSSSLPCRIRSRGSREAVRRAVGVVMAALDSPPPTYRANVGVCLVNKENKVFVASRIDTPGAWQMPQGGIDDGETPAQAAVRELREETGVTSAKLLGEAPHWLTYDFPPVVKERLTRIWGKAWDGQAQRWFLFRFTGDDSEVDLLGDGSEPPEFSEWKWVAIDDVVSSAVDFKRPVYEAAFAAFNPMLSAARC